jgi:ABC-type nitrate/sulfonate/bicarbonate transport system permease component
MMPRPRRRSYSARLHLPTWVVVVWELLSRQFGSYVLPSPLAVLRGLQRVGASGELWRHTSASLLRIVIGFSAALPAALLLEMAQVYKLSAGDCFRSIVMPSTIPYLVAGMKVGFGLALKVSVVAEIFGVTAGIGYIMNYSREILATEMVFAWAVVMILIMMACDKLLFESLARRVEAWR